MNRSLVNSPDILLSWLSSCPVWDCLVWLHSFAYRASLGWCIFALAGVLAVGIAMLTVMIQSIKASLQGPVRSLKME
ncbi:MAG TPA: hypothetical protein VM802_28390 [Chitinophaga sp.]|uniref:hypothetical protein n=1 Tax=Chitinophaga sp. TaxID=1869181 RepID=UPI002B8E51A9|nr:hypothetical protein [Chitinophaga sp.]HVI48822.1 hypothetical protein [Chitinophaga sp.]